MNVTSIVNTRRRLVAGFWTFNLDAGHIVSIEGPRETIQAAPAGAGVIDAAGGLITPALVDPHLHLDQAFARELVAEEQLGDPSRADELWARLKAEIGAEDVRARAVRALRAEIRYGTAIFRGHVDVSAAAGMRFCEGALAAREETRNDCKVLLTACPLDGLVRDPAAVDHVRQAAHCGFDLVGGNPDAERGPRDGLRHLELVFDLAAEFDANIDAHVDNTVDPQSRYTERLAALTIERGWQGRVTASGVWALASYDDEYAARVIDKLAEARVNVVISPAVTLYRRGRLGHHPAPRGIARLTALLDAGIICGVGQDHLQDLFYPLGTGQMLEQAFLLVHAEQMGTPQLIQQAMELVCCHSGEVVGLGHHRPEVSASANLAVWPAETTLELIRQRPRPRAVLHAGRLVGGTLSGDDDAIGSR